MAKCGFKIEAQESRNYEYGPGKEFETKEQALEFARKTLSSIKTKLSLERCWNLYESSEIIEGEGFCKIKMNMKRLVIDF